MGVYNMPPYLGIVRNVNTDPDENVDGDLIRWNSSDRLWKRVQDSALPGSQKLFASTADDTIANTVAETNFSPAGVGSTTIAASSLVVGQVYRIRASGILSTV